MARYTDEKQVQILIALMKAHGVTHVIASPGATNLTFVASIQSDPFFTIYSAVDERSAGYLACGLAGELGAPVAISCTGATASRNYMPGLTEAFYRKLPILAITSTQRQARVGHHVAQVIDRSSIPKDVVKLSVDLPVVRDAEDVWECEIKVNRAILELSRRGGGPVHINVPTEYSRDYSHRQLLAPRQINRWTVDDPELPSLTGRVAVRVGSHKAWTKGETDAIERFCEVNNAVIFCDHTSGYHGKYRIIGALVGGQEDGDKTSLRPDVLIHIGEVSGDYETHSLSGKEVWRVSPDGEIRDTFRSLRHVFEMTEERFFNLYSQGSKQTPSFYQECSKRLEDGRANLPELPFSNLWFASQYAHRVPRGATIHFAILNSLRAWNFFELNQGVRSSSNVGGFGIDGCTSTLIGASLANPADLYFLITGDLAFFYDLNALGTRHLRSNVRVLLVNNGKGTEFTQHNHAGSALGASADKYVAAEGHFGSKSPTLVRNFCESLGLEYFSVRDTNEADTVMARFFSSEKFDKPLLVEAFVDASDESNALRMVKNLEVGGKARARKLAKGILGPKGVKGAKRILGM